MIAAVPLVLGAAVGIAALGDAWTIRFTRVSLAYGAIFVAINFFDLGRTRFDPSTQSILGLRPVLDGAPWGLRLTPYPDVLTRVVEQLDKLLPPGTPARCYCFSPKPYPIAASGQRPAVTFDSLLVGPENLEAALRLSGRQVPWALGYVPYPLTCSGFRVAADCASVSVSGGGAEGAYPSGERLAAERRRWLMENSSRWAVINLNGLPPIELRTPLSPAPCTSPEGSVLLSRLDSVLDGCPGDDYYRAALTGLLAPLERRANEVERARDLSLQRRRALDEGRFPSALVFGDAFLVDSTLRALKTTEGTNEPIVPPPLELGAFKVAWSGFRLSAPLMARRRVDASVTIRNAGTQTWPTALAVGAPHAVRLSYAWLDSEGRVVTPMVPRFELPHSLDPHQSLTMVLQIDGPPLPGEYVLKLDLVQELDTWFEEKGSEPLAVPVEVFP